MRPSGHRNPWPVGCWEPGRGGSRQKAVSPESGDLSKPRDKEQVFYHWNKAENVPGTDLIQNFQGSLVHVSHRGHMAGPGCQAAELGDTCSELGKKMVPTLRAAPAPRQKDGPVLSKPTKCRSCAAPRSSQRLDKDRKPETRAGSKSQQARDSALARPGCLLSPEEDNAAIPKIRRVVREAGCSQTNHGLLSPASSQGLVRAGGAITGPLSLVR